VSDSKGEILERAREVLRVEGEAVLALVDRVGEGFTRAVELVREADGRVVVSGLGKSGLVARKVASTLASTGTPAVFLHPVEGVHGDLGLVVEGDVLLLVSKSGETREITDLLPAVQDMGVPVLAITGDPGSTLARRADVVLDAGVPSEACPLDLAPTASSTAALALGDALAMTLLTRRGFGAEDFARLHPGGALGRRLLWSVRDAMVDDPDDVPSVTPGAPLSEAMHEIAFRRGTVPVVDGDGRVEGVITAGDLTRFAGSHPDFLERPTREAMSRDPHLAAPDTRAADAVRTMEEEGIMAMPVVDGDRRLVGIVHLHDLLRAGVA
jgi:arabinose-5-phosphate isomerase